MDQKEDASSKARVPTSQSNLTLIIRFRLRKARKGFRNPLLRLKQTTTPQCLSLRTLKYRHL